MDCRDSSDFTADFTAPGYKSLPGIHGCERAVLGLSLREPDNAPSVISALPGPLVFNDPMHRKIFEAIRDTCAEGKKPDLPTVQNRLVAAKADDSDMIVTYASDLIDEGFLSRTDQHCAMIEEDYARRRLHTVAWIAMEELRRGEPASEVLSKLSLQAVRSINYANSMLTPFLQFPKSWTSQGASAGRSRGSSLAMASPFSPETAGWVRRGSRSIWVSPLRSG